jgi:hypothetical protein
MASISHISTGPRLKAGRCGSRSLRFRNRANWSVALGMYDGVLTGLDVWSNIRSFTIGVADT